jgi:hypothetical protein
MKPTILAAALATTLAAPAFASTTAPLLQCVGNGTAVVIEKTDVQGGGGGITPI